MNGQLSSMSGGEARSNCLQSADRLVVGLKPPQSVEQRLDVNFNTDPMFVRAGQNGVSVPRGLNAVESDTAVPVLKFKSDDAYATASELTRRASAAKEMRAALAAQISAKRMVTSKAVNADDYYEAHLEASRTLDVQDAAYASPRPRSDRVSGLPTPSSDCRLASFRGSPSPTACSLTAREAREPVSSPTPRGPSSESVIGRGAPIPARRAAAAREIQGALEAQMRAAALLQSRMDATPITSSDADNASSSGLVGDSSPSQLATWEENVGSHEASPGSDALSSGLSAADWQTRLRLRRSMPAVAAASRADPDAEAAAAPPPPAGGGAAAGATPQPSPPNTSNSTAESHISFERGSARSLHSTRSGRLSHPDDAKSAGGRLSGPPSARGPSHDPLGPITRPAVPTLRFASDDVYATEAELAARAAASARLRADLDRQVAEKQQRREQERLEEGDNLGASGRFRRPLLHRSGRSSSRQDPTSRRGTLASPRSVHSTRFGPPASTSRSPREGPRSTRSTSGLVHVTDGFAREGSARENDLPVMHDAAELALHGLEGLKRSHSARPPLQPSGNSMPSPRPLVSARYTQMPTPLFDSADTTPLPTARDSVDGPLSARGEPQSARGVPRSARGEPLSARGRPASSDTSPRIPLPSPRQVGQFQRSRAPTAASAGSMAAVGSGSGALQEEDPVQRAWRLAKEEAEVVRKRRVRQHAAVASPELLADLEPSAETPASSDAVEAGLHADSAAAPTLPRVDSTDETSMGTTCSTEFYRASVPCGDRPTKPRSIAGRRRPWSWFTCCLCSRG
eukprot:jgi/Ulvmu1/10688/UM067_0014.1